VLGCCQQCLLQLTDAISVHERDDAMDNDEVRELLRQEHRTTHSSSRKGIFAVSPGTGCSQWLNQ
jgi:hypothetical protein